MGALRIVQKNADCDGDIDWPLFYMNDFSVLGLLVDSLTKTLEVLEADDYQVVREACSAVVRFENRSRFKNIFDILRHHRIEFGTSDLVRCAYQG
jgi:hypothetical protein